MPRRAVPVAALSRGAKFLRTRDPAASQPRTATLLPLPPSTQRRSPVELRGERGEAASRPPLPSERPSADPAPSPPPRPPPSRGRGSFTWSARRPPHSRGARGRLRRRQPRMLRAAPLALRRRADGGSSKPPSAPAAPLRCTPLPQAEPAAARGWRTAQRRTKSESSEPSAAAQRCCRGFYPLPAPPHPRRATSAAAGRSRRCPGEGRATAPLRLPPPVRPRPLLSAPHRGCPSGGLRQLSAERRQSSPGHIWARSAAAAAQGSWEGAAASARSPINAWQLPLRGGRRNRRAENFKRHCAGSGKQFSS